MPATAQLEFDFRVPCHDPITPVEAAKCLNVPVADVYSAIYSGKLAATNLASDGATSAAYRIPLKNFVAYLNAKYADELYFHFPAADLVTPFRIAKALSCSDQHVYNLIADGEFPSAINNARKGSRRAAWRIPLRDLVAFVNRRREGAW